MPRPIEPRTRLLLAGVDAGLSPMDIATAMTLPESYVREVMRRHRPHKLAPASGRKAKIINLIKSGMRHSDIAREVRVTRSYVSQLAKHHKGPS